MSLHKVFFRWGKKSIYLLLHVIVFQLCFLQASAQDKRDSLMSVLKSARHDTTRAATLVSIAQQYENVNPDTAIKISNHVLALVEKHKGEVSQQVRHSYLLSKGKAMMTLGNCHYALGKPNEALEYFLQDLTIFRQIKNTKGMLYCLNVLAYIYDEQGKFKEALAYNFELLDLAKKVNDTEHTGSALNNIGYLYHYQGKIEEALNYYQQTLKLARKGGEQNTIASALNNIGYVYSTQGDFQNALKYYLQVLKIRRNLKDDAGIAVSLGNIGSIYMKQGNHQKAMKFFEEALTISKKINKPERIAAALIKIGACYSRSGDEIKALDYFKQSLVINEKTGIKRDLFASLFQIATSLNNQKKDAEALRYAQRAYEISKELAQPDETQDIASLLSKIYEKQGNGMKALEMHKLYIHMRDSINNEQTRKASIKNQIQNEYDIKAAADSVAHLKEKQIKESEIAKHKAEVKAKRNEQYLLYGGLLIVAVFSIFIFNRFKITQKQKTVIEEQKHLVEEKNKEITDSINYAKRIQAAILPPEKLIKEAIPESFVLYKPKDIVAGDFYWMERKEDKILFAVADCTGHGVPGAMVSVICNNGLNRSVREHNLSVPGDILFKTREIVISEFEKSEEEVKDGMDISICAIRKSGEFTEVEWAGANNPFWYIQNGALQEVKPHKQPIGKVENPTQFPTHTFRFTKGDMIYLLTDGYPDQFGGDSGKKFKYKKLQELLFSISAKPLKEQKELLDQEFENWRGKTEQIDDVTLVGIRI